MFAGQVLHAFQFDHQHIFHQDIGEVFANRLALVDDGERSLCIRRNAAQRKLSQQGALLDLFQEPGSQSIGDLKNRSDYAFGQRVQGSLFIRFHRHSSYRRSSAFIGGHLLFASGIVGIGTPNPQYKLAVNGNIGAQDIIVTNTGWSD